MVIRFRLSRFTNLDGDKNKGKHKCSYFMNSQMKKELAEYLKYLQGKWGEDLNPETYLFTSQKLNKPYNRVSISRLFSSIYSKFGIKGASHLGRHLFVSKLVNAGVNICIVQRLANHSERLPVFTGSVRKLLLHTELTFLSAKVVPASSWFGVRFAD